ncbi:MAG: chemotaxis protein CheA [Deltaproteobacteria bacterium]|nr:chemotaxis protein CheA [Deltaproteobacteria bacterium]
MDMSPYRDLFVSESRGHITAFNDLIVRLEGNAVDRGIIDELFRHAHSLKGMAATMQLQPVAELAHAMEDLMSKVRSGEFPLTPAMADLLLEGSDLLGGLIGAFEAGDGHLADVADLVKRIASFSPGSAQTAPLADTSAKGEPAAGKNGETAPPQQQLRQSDPFKSVRIRTETLDRLVNITGELITTRYRLADQAQRCPQAMLNEPLGRLSALLRELRDEVFQARMLPFSLVAERFPRLVRDLARKQGKEVAFHLEGEEIELDRGILEEIAEPLVHILRNAVDHGMETPAERAAAGKPDNGVISITVTRDKDHVRICVADDGRGMSPALLRARAVEKGLVSSARAEAMTTQEALMLVCAPGFSTAETVGDVSGRGVGMDAVRSAVHNLGGTLEIETEGGSGSRFTLKLPITVSIINALLVECGRLTVAFPVNTVDRAVELGPDEIHEEGGRKACTLDGRSIPLRSLNRLLGQPLPKGGAPRVPAILTGMSGAPGGVVADRILGQQEIFVKPLGIPLSNIRCISGGTVMGDGSIVFVMDAGTFA